MRRDFAILQRSRVASISLVPYLPANSDSNARTRLALVAASASGESSSASRTREGNGVLMDTRRSVFSRGSLGVGRHRHDDLGEVLRVRGY